MITKTNKKPEPVRALFPYLDSIASTKTKATQHNKPIAKAPPERPQSP